MGAERNVDADEVEAPCRQPSRLDAPVDEAGLDSFPASDPPGWWSGLSEAVAPDGPAHR